MSQAQLDACTGSSLVATDVAVCTVGVVGANAMTGEEWLREGQGGYTVKSWRARLCWVKKELVTSPSAFVDSSVNDWTRGSS